MNTYYIYISNNEIDEIRNYPHSTEIEANFDSAIVHTSDRNDIISFSYDGENVIEIYGVYGEEQLITPTPSEGS